MLTRCLWIVLAVLLVVVPGVVRAEADLSTPKSAAIVFAKAIEDGDVAAAKSAATSTPHSDAFLDAMGALVKSGKKLEAAVVARFGDAGKQVIGPQNAKIADELNTAQVKEEGETAELTTSNPEQRPLNLRKVGDQWKVDVTSVMPESEMSRMSLVLNAMSSAMNEMTQEVNDGKYATPEAAKAAVEMKVVAAMQAEVAKAVVGSDPSTTQPASRPALPPEAESPPGRPVEDMK